MLLFKLILKLSILDFIPMNVSLCKKTLLRLKFFILKLRLKKKLLWENVPPVRYQNLDCSAANHFFSELNLNPQSLYKTNIL